MDKIFPEQNLHCHNYILWMGTLKMCDLLKATPSGSG